LAVPPWVPARAEVVGSLLRPLDLRRAVEAFYEPCHSAVLGKERAKDLRPSGTSRTRRSATPSAGRSTSASTSSRTVEGEEELIRSMEEAATLAGGLERLAISPQRGFASVMVGNEIDEDTQWRKLDLVARVADRLWG